MSNQPSAGSSSGSSYPPPPAPPLPPPRASSRMTNALSRIFPWGNTSRIPEVQADDQQASNAPRGIMYVWLHLFTTRSSLAFGSLLYSARVHSLAMFYFDIAYYQEVSWENLPRNRNAQSVTPSKTFLALLHSTKRFINLVDHVQLSVGRWFYCLFQRYHGSSAAQYAELV